jgi:Thioesterase-like superfamily
VSLVTSPEPVGSYYAPLPDGRYQPTTHVQGVWNDHEQHMGPVSGLMELLEATLVAGHRPVVRARAWRIASGDTADVAGGLPDPLPPPESFAPWNSGSVWSGGYIASLDMRGHPDNTPGRGRGWIHSAVSLVEGVDVSPTAAYVMLVDTANGIAVPEDPHSWMYPNVDLGVHLFREPVAGWVGFDTTVTFGAAGLGLTSSTLYDVEGPVGRSEQALTVRRVTPPGT